MPITNVLPIATPALNVTGLVILHLNVEVPAPDLPRIQGNLTGFVVEAENPEVEVSLHYDKSTKQQRYLNLQPKLMTSMT